MKLSELNLNQKAVIVKISAEKKVRVRLLRLGIVEKAECEVVKFSPFKKNVLLKVKSDLIGIRLSLADNILVKEI